MKDKRNQDERLETLMCLLAESVLELSDKAVVAETSEAGADLQEEAECTRLVLRQASEAIDNVSRRLSNLGHTIDSSLWVRGQRNYHNRCLDCGSFVRFTTTTGETYGDALDSPCPVSGQYPIRRREASH